MAEKEQLERLTRSIEEWNLWREQYSILQPDLNGAFLYEAKLREVNLSRANLNSINLSYADLSGADLGSANLRYADLRYANLSKADLSRTDLSRSNLMEANLSGADLSGADLMYTNLRSVNLRSTNLSRADLSRADLDEADLSHTRMWGTILGELNLSSVKGLEMVIHMGPSHLSIRTLYLSHGDIPEVFVRGTGVPDSFIEHMHLLIASPMEYHTVFISSSGLDQAFAERLYADLQDKSVQCWMAPHDLRPGDYHHSRIDEAIHRHEKVLLLLSEHAVNSSWVKHEVQIALAREINQDRTILFPLRLDQAVMQTKVDWAVRLRESRHIGDFTAWQDDAAYQQAFSILLRDLKVDRLPTL